MIGVSGWQPAPAAPDVEIDPYVPVTVTFPAYHEPEPLRSTVLHGPGGVVELKVRAATGEVVEVVVPTGTPIAAPGPLAPPALDHSGSVPTLEFPDAPARHEAPVTLTVHQDAVVLTLGSEPPITFGGTARTQFGVDSSGHLAVIAVAVSAEQAAELLEG